jgi:hypothetical protein
MKSVFKFALIVLSCLALAAPAFAGSFTNGGFENGNFAGWTQGAGCWDGGFGCAPLSPYPLTPGDYLLGGQYYQIGYNASAVVTSYLDPLTDNHLNSVYNGTYSARVNDSFNDYSVSVISQSVKNYTDPFMYFAWAAVLQASHGPTDSDNFTLELTDDTRGTVLYSAAFNSATNGSMFSLSSSNWYYTAWQVQQLDVTALEGDDFTLTLLGSDCPYGGHAGYVYLDGFGAAPPPPSTPEPGTLALLGSGAIFAANWLRRRF